MKEIQSLLVTVVHSHGDFGKPQYMTFALHFSCILWPTGAKGNGTVAEAERGFAEFELGDAECRALCRAAEAAGFGERVPNVQGIADTSDRGAHVSIMVSTELGTRFLLLNLMCSGYGGPDAAALRRFFLLLLRPTPLRHESILHDLTDLRELP